MWLSHIVFAINFYKMTKRKKEIVIPRSAPGILEALARKEMESSRLDAMEGKATKEKVTAE